MAAMTPPVFSSTRAEALGLPRAGPKSITRRGQGKGRGKRVKGGHGKGWLFAPLLLSPLASCLLPLASPLFPSCGYTRAVPHRLTVGDIMTREVVTLAEDDTLADARTCMERGRIRHLPVVRGKKLVGLVTHRDLLSASFSVFAEVSAQEERRLFRQIPVPELMHDAYAVPPTLRVRDAAKVMLDKQYGCLPVVDGEENLIGIVTEADFLRLAVRMLDAIQA